MPPYYSSNFIDIRALQEYLAIDDEECTNYAVRLYDKAYTAAAFFGVILSRIIMFIVIVTFFIINPVMFLIIKRRREIGGLRVRCWDPGSFSFFHNAGFPACLAAGGLEAHPPAPWCDFTFGKQRPRWGVARVCPAIDKLEFVTDPFDSRGFRDGVTA